MQSGNSIILLNFLDIRFIDAIKYLGGALKNLVKQFPKIRVSKGEFPHCTNLITNYNKIFPQLPPINLFIDQAKNDDEKEKLTDWHNLNIHTSWNFNVQILKYCDTGTYITYLII